MVNSTQEHILRGGGIEPCPGPAAKPAKCLENRAVGGLGRVGGGGFSVSEPSQQCP
jgi:hypothetical protein